MKQSQKAGNLPVEIQLQQIKYLNNMIGQDHRFIKKRVRYMLGFQSFQTESTTQAGIEAMQMIKKGQPLQEENSLLNQMLLIHNLFGITV